jgi:predicted CoA-binding protein
MTSLAAAAADFLAQRRIAVAGVSRDKPNAANIIYRRLRADGYQVFAVNPAADSVEGDPCYRALDAIPGGVDAVVVGTAPAAALQVAEECAAAGVRRLWLHRGPGGGSVSEAAVRYCEEHGIAVIGGACPMMFIKPTDFAHRCMCWLLGRLGRLPDASRYDVAVRR